MEENREFLRYLIDEDIYVIKSDAMFQIDKVATQENTNTKQTGSDTNGAIAAERPLHFQGSTASGVAIVVNNSDTDFLTTEEKTLLSKILAAIKLQLNDVAVINLKDNDHLTQNLLKEVGIVRCLVFDSNSPLVKADLYEPIQAMGIAFLKCNNLGVISAEVSEKKMLWAQLQKLFLSK